MRRLVGIFLGAFMLSAAVPVGAHPHVWIEAQATLAFKQGKVAAVRMRWALDEFFSSALIRQFDKDKDKRFNASEVAEVQKNAFSNLKKHSYFTYLRVAGKTVKVSEVTDFKASIEKGRLIYHFTVPLVTPVDPVKTGFGLTLYDKTFYVDVQLQKETPLRLVGEGSAGCTHTVAKDKKNPIYFGMVFPRVATLRCTGS